MAQTKIMRLKRVTRKRGWIEPRNARQKKWKRKPCLLLQSYQTHLPKQVDVGYVRRKTSTEVNLLHSGKYISSTVDYIQDNAQTLHSQSIIIHKGTDDVVCESYMTTEHRFTGWKPTWSTTNILLVLNSSLNETNPPRDCRGMYLEWFLHWL